MVHEEGHQSQRPAGITACMYVLFGRPNSQMRTLTTGFLYWRWRAAVSGGAGWGGALVARDSKWELRVRVGAVKAVIVSSHLVLSVILF